MQSIVIPLHKQNTIFIIYDSKIRQTLASNNIKSQIN